MVYLEGKVDRMFASPGNSYENITHIAGCRDSQTKTNSFVQQKNHFILSKYLLKTERDFNKPLLDRYLF